jgi:hypothetical protein
MVLTGLLMGFICNQLVRPLTEEHAMTAEQQQQAKGLYTINKDAQLTWEARPSTLLTVSWLAVSVPLLGASAPPSSRP